MNKRIATIIMKEWLLIISILGLFVTSLWVKHLPAYTIEGLKPIFLLFSLFVCAKGVEESYFFQYLAKHIEGANLLAPKLVLLSFFLSLFLSIDVSLVVILPILFSMKIPNKINLAVIVSMTAHIGAALTPFGTPQNLFIFSFYHLHMIEFVKVIFPFSILMFLLFFISSFFIKVKYIEYKDVKLPKVNRVMTLLYLLFLIIVILVLFEVIPIFFAIFPPLFALLFDEKSLKIDYLLLLTFIVFMGLSENISEIIKVWITHPEHIFLITAGLSQIISNVPATLLIEKFTNEWRAILWGSNAGSFGTPIAAMANLIAYRLFLAYNSEKKESNIYLLRFTIFNIIALFIGIGLYFCYLGVICP